METLIELKANLEKKGYAVSVFESKEEAAAYMNGQIDGKTVGIGGSATVNQMGLYDLLCTHNTVVWHDRKPAEMTVAQARLAAAQSEIYVSSVNGISLKGEIVNIDNTGNRVAAMTFGPKKVYLVIGANKLAPDLDGAVYRARNIAAPLNAKRLNRKTPCAIKADKCYDCNSNERICRNLSVFWEKPTGVDYEIILINEGLGF